MIERFEVRALPLSNNTPRRTVRQRARRSETDEKIADAVLTLIRLDGLDAVTIDRVAAQSGVAKTTIYRRYDDRYAMLSGVAESLATAPAEEYSLTATGLRALIENIQDIFEQRVGLATVGALLASRRTALEDWRERVVTPQMSTLTTFFDRGVAAGVLRPDIDYGQLVEMIIGGLVTCDARRGHVPDDWHASTVAMIWPSITVGEPSST